MKYSLIAMAALSACAAATGDKKPWINAEAFNIPGQGNQKCLKKQVDPETFADCKDGDLSSLNGMEYSGLQCFTEKPGKRWITPRTNYGGGGGGNGKCAKGNTKNKPTIRTSKGNTDGFTVDQYHVKPDRDTNMEFDYTMKGGKKCKETVRCSKDGTDVKPKLCAGAEQVQIGVPRNEKDCDFKISKIIWLCKTQATTTTSSTKTLTTTTPVTTTTTSTSNVGTVPTPPTTTTPPMTLATTSPVVTNPPGTNTTTTTTCELPSTMSGSVCAPPKTTTDNSGPPTTTCVLPSTMSGSVCAPPKTTTGNSGPPTTTCAPPMTMSGTVCAPPPPPPTTTETPCTKCAPIPVDCPQLVPQCLNSFLYMAKCKDNTDTECMCQNQGFAINVFACFYGYGANAVEIQAAVVNFQGLCAQAIPSMPVYVTVPASYSSVAGLPEPTGPAPTGPMNSAVVTITSDGQTVTSTVTFPPVQITGSGPDASLIQSSAGPVQTTAAAPTTTSSPSNGPVYNPTTDVAGVPTFLSSARTIQPLIGSAILAFLAVLAL